MHLNSIAVIKSKISTMNILEAITREFKQQHELLEKTSEMAKFQMCVQAM
jgi:hypothetical protein